MTSRRSDIEIMGDILRLGNAGKTQIMYNADLSYCQLQKYLGFLTEHGFMEKLPSNNSHYHYNLTPKGETLLGHINKVINLLGLDGEDISNGKNGNGQLNHMRSAKNQNGIKGENQTEGTFALSTK
jgi:predicted transcriptional regulator